jgi:hypothetical protein
VIDQVSVALEVAPETPSRRKVLNRPRADALMKVYSLLDLTPLRLQEEGEGSLWARAVTNK